LPIRRNKLLAIPGKVALSEAMIIPAGPQKPSLLTSHRDA
jgi:hypothetical protein